MGKNIKLIVDYLLMGGHDIEYLKDSIEEYLKEKI